MSWKAGEVREVRVADSEVRDEVVHDRAASRFILRRGGHEIGELTYRASDGRAALLHTEVRPDLRGKGLARALVVAAVQWARAERLKLTPLCWYTRVVLERADEFHDVL
jgi:predicted GNAT family acetyltransferase